MALIICASLGVAWCILLLNKTIVEQRALIEDLEDWRDMNHELDNEIAAADRALELALEPWWCTMVQTQARP